MKHSKSETGSDTGTLPIKSDQVFRVYQRTLAGFGLILFAVTWKLWTPQTAFPQIPFFGFLVETPAVVDWICFVTVAGSLLVCLITNSPDIARRANLTFAIGAIVLILFDQQRLQPWAFQFVVFSIVMATARPQQALFWMRWIVISIYVYSAISKFDYQFVHTVGDQLFTQLVRLVRLDASEWNSIPKSWLILSFPTGELLVGCALAFPKTRRAGIYGAIGLHAMLLLLLGPIGLGHQPGVLIWNLFFVAQVVLLFGTLNSFALERPAPRPPEAVSQRPVANQGRRRRVIVPAIAWLVILFPLTRMAGLCDHWPAWEVYAPHCSRAKIISNRSLNASRPSWHSLSDWSLSELAVPIYPQARFQLAVAIAVSEKHHLDREIQVVLEQESDRWSGARETTTLIGEDQLKMAASRYWLNSKARRIYFSSTSEQ